MQANTYAKNVYEKINYNRKICATTQQWLQCHFHIMEYNAVIKIISYDIQCVP